VVAEGPELVARSDNEAREPETVVLREILTTNMDMYLRKVT